MSKTKHEKNRKTILRTILLMAAMAIGIVLAGGIIPAKVQASEDTPLPPTRPYLYQTGKDWVMLAWDTPDSGNPRSADHYLIYQDGKPKALNADNPTPAGQQHFLITGLNPDTEYRFWFAGMKGNVVGEKASLLDAKTLPDTGVTIIGPSDQWGNVGDTVTFDAQLNGLEAGYTAEFIWQICGLDIKDDWRDLPNSNSEQHAVLIENNRQNNTRYRVKIDIKKDVPYGKPMVKDSFYSKTATLHINEPGKKPVARVMLEAEYADNHTPFPEYNGEYYIKSGTSINLKAHVTDSTGMPLSSGVVAFQYINDERTVVIGERLPGSGYASISDFLVRDPGIYRFVAVYPPPSNDMPGSMSPAVVIHVGLDNTDYYSIDYEMNGGTNDLGNPAATAITPQPVTLKEPSKAYAVFGGWYADHNFINPITVLNAGTLQKLDNGNRHIILYAKWENTTYSIQYELNGGSNHPDNPDTYTAYETAGLKNPQRAGYKFEGWYTDEQYVNQITSLPLRDENGGLVPPENVILYARWTVQKDQNTDESKQPGQPDQPDQPDKTGDKAEGAPKTGDTSYTLLWICFAVISAGAASVIIIKKRKHREDM